jgi:hypothetical protein
MKTGPGFPGPGGFDRAIRSGGESHACRAVGSDLDSQGDRFDLEIIAICGDVIVDGVGVVSAKARTVLTRSPLSSCMIGE